MKKNIEVLVIEDDPHISDLLDLYLSKEGYDTIFAADGEEGLEKYFDRNPDFVILDIMLPKMDGWEVCKEIHRDERSVPVLMLTGKGESYDKVRGLELGADDYVVKPFDPKEVIARIKAIIRRTSPSVSKPALSFPNMTLDISQYRLVRKGEFLTLPPKELELLYYLAANSNQVFTRQQLVDQIWGFDYEGDVRTVDVHIKRIRQKIGDEFPGWQLKTIHGIGYKFEVQDLW